MKPIGLLYYAIALGFPPLLFTQLLNNYNETHPVQVFVLCIVLGALAGWLASVKFPLKNRLIWVGGSVAAGIVIAIMLTVFV